MIVSEILGGLGNQMFQYAVGLSLATKLDTDLYLDKTQFNTYKTHEFGLDSLALTMKFTEPDEYFLYKKDNTITGNAKAYIKRLKANKPVLNVYREKAFTYDPAVLDLQDNTYLMGYFQSEEYFLSIKDVLIESFKPKKMSKSVEALSSIILKTPNSLSLHVRRGDYVNNPAANKYHGTKGTDYYAAALARIKKSKKESAVFVFSDDIAWCKKNIKISNKNVTWVDGNNTAIEDIYLMSLCEDNIIANSTFSWWGAWLNKNPGKIVVAPKIWFSDPSIDTSDLIPDSWIRL